MPTGAAQLALRSVKGSAIDDMVTIRFTPAASSGGGGQIMRTPEFAYRQAPACRITNIACAGAGTDYIANVEGQRFRSTGIVVRVTPEEQPARTIRLFTDPSRVRDISARSFDQLAASLRDVLSSSEVPAFPDTATGGFLQGDRLTVDSMHSERPAC